MSLKVQHVFFYLVVLIHCIYCIERSLKVISGSCNKIMNLFFLFFCRIEAVKENVAKHEFNLSELYRRVLCRNTDRFSFLL